MYQLGWFSTGRDKAARDLLTAVNNSIKQGEIEAEIAFVFCSREAGEAGESDLFIKLIEDYRIPLICFSYQKFKANDELTLRIQRIYEAVDAVVETDISKFIPKVIKDGTRIGFYHDWSGSRSNAEIENIAHILIYNVANSKDHLKKWAIRNGKDKAKVNAAFRGSQALKIIKDLSNNDRHGYDPVKRGNSGKSPRVDKINTIMQMTTTPKKDSFISLILNRQGTPKITGSGDAKVIITGDILDRDGTKIGDLYKTLLEAVGIWEKVLSEFGVQIPRQSTPTTDQTGTLPPWRLDYDREVMNRLQGFSPDLCVLAGYMLIVGREMCQRYNMINLHPAAPGGPAGTWQEVIWQLIDSEAQQTGVMIHLVTPELDKGPPVAYCTFPIRGEPFDRYWQKLGRLPVNSPERHDARNSLFQLIRKHGLTREFPLIISTLKAFSEGDIKINKEKQVVDSKGRPIKGYNLTAEINEVVK